MSEPAGAIVCESARLRLRRLTLADAPFIRDLVNEPSWLAMIGDRGVRTIADAERYLLEGPIASHARRGFGLDRIERKEDGAVIGLCGLLRRSTLADVDLGFALSPPYWSRGYAREAAAAARDHALGSLGLRRLVAITLPENAASIAVLEAIGMTFERMIRLTPDAEALRLYALERAIAAP